MANPTGKNQYTGGKGGKAASPKKGRSLAAEATAKRMARVARNKELYTLMTGKK